MSGGGSGSFPFFIELDALRQVFCADLLHRPIWIAFLKPVDVIALGVELFASQIRQAVDVIAIIEAIPRQGKGEFPRVKLFQAFFFRLGQGVEAQGLARALASSSNA